MAFEHNKNTHKIIEVNLFVQITNTFQLEKQLQFSGHSVEKQNKNINMKIAYIRFTQ